VTRLRQIQSRFAAAVMAPLRGDALDRRSPDVRAAAVLVRPNDALDPAGRLEIYARSYWFRVLDALSDDFPGLRALLGPRRFDRLARAYLAACPSSSFTLRDLGSRLAEWLERNPAFAGSNHRLALDTARLEWARIKAFDGPARPALAAPVGRPGLQPHISLLALEYPVDRSRSRRVRAKRTYVAVHRQEAAVYYRRLEPAEFRLLSAIQAGCSLGRAVRTAFGDSVPAPEQVRDWFSAWARLGWLTEGGPYHSVGL